MQDEPVDTKQPDPPKDRSEADSETGQEPETERPREIGGRPGPEPTRYGDWEKNGRCIDF
jgi:hypothetical protein